MAEKADMNVSFRIEKVWKEGFVITKYRDGQKDSTLMLTHIHSTMDTAAALLQLDDNKLINLRKRSGTVVLDGKKTALYEVDMEAIYRWFDGLYGTLLLKDAVSGEEFYISSFAHNEGEKNRWIAELNH